MLQSVMVATKQWNYEEEMFNHLSGSVIPAYVFHYDYNFNNNKCLQRLFSQIYRLSI